MSGNCVPSMRNNLPITNDGEFTYLSEYVGEPVTKDEIAFAVSRLRGNFTAMADNNVFWTELQSQIVKCGFTGQRLLDAVDYVIQNNPYREIRIADIVNYGRGAKLYTYSQMSDICWKNQVTTDEFEIVRTANGNFWKSKSGKF